MSELLFRFWCQCLFGCKVFSLCCCSGLSSASHFCTSVKSPWSQSCLALQQRSPWSCQHLIHPQVIYYMLILVPNVVEIFHQTIIIKLWVSLIKIWCSWLWIIKSTLWSTESQKRYLSACTRGSNTSNLASIWSTLSWITLTHTRSYVLLVRW